MELGLRVVRGPHWKWQNQDGGEGHVGTVVEVGKPGNNSTPDKTVVVQWDSGFRTNYRIGYQNSYDLRIFDNAPAGVKHQNIICDACKKAGIQGMRWKCAKCYDFDLCHECYMSDKHDLNHSFLRFTTPDVCTGVKVSKRNTSTKVKARGIFPGAKVVRGVDWDWGNQDGGEMQPGRVEDIRGWDNESGRSVANVLWMSTGGTNVYRLGHKGKMDIKYIEESTGGSYYKDHLPVLGETVDASPAKDTHSMYKVGDKVKVILEEEVLKPMQEGHGGWNPRMAEYIGLIGTVHRITDRGDVRVQYEGCSNRWTFNSGALTKVHQFGVGDYVKISSDIQKVKELQRGHGDWADTMMPALGKTGKIVKVYADGDLRVNVAGNNWTFNAKCVIAVPHGQEDANNTLDRHTERRPPTDPTEAIREELLDVLVSPSDQQVSSRSPTAQPDPDRLVREAAQGHLDMVSQIISVHPDKVDRRSSGKSGLQVACHQGHREVVQFLLTSGADMSQQDEDGDTALHYAVFGDQPEIAELLLSQGAQVNAVNKGGCSSLHVAVNKQHLRCLQSLLSHKANVNIQDAYGDTPLHDAMGKESEAIIDLLLSQPDINLMTKNRRGFNVLHHAALKGNPQATEMIVAKSPQTVDSKKDDGFAALHLACLNGHLKVAEILINKGRADIEICNNRKQTPLLLAVSQGHATVVQLLVDAGCNLKATDENGDTCLHLAVMRHTMPTADLDRAPDIAKFVAELEAVDSERRLPVAMACFLIDKGADFKHRNNQGKVPLDIVSDTKIIQILQKIAESKHPPPPALVECLSCCEMAVCVTFKPCGHSVVCFNCSRRMKKCVKCRKIIDNKSYPGCLGVEVSEEDEETMKDLKDKLQELEDRQMCNICMERLHNVAFRCGHQACSHCAETLERCHMCRKPVTERIQLF